MLTKASGLPLMSGLSPPTTTALAPRRCASLTLLTNSHSPLCTRAIHVSPGSGSCGPSIHNVGQPRLGGGSAKETLSVHGMVNEESGITYPRSGSFSSAPKAAGLEANERG